MSCFVNGKMSDQIWSSKTSRNTRDSPIQTRYGHKCRRSWPILTLATRVCVGCDCADCAPSDCIHNHHHMGASCQVQGLSARTVYRPVHDQRDATRSFGGSRDCAYRSVVPRRGAYPCRYRHRSPRMASRLIVPNANIEEQHLNIRLLKAADVKGAVRTSSNIRKNLLWL